MNTNRTFIKNLTAGDTFMLVGGDTLYVVESVTNESPYTTVRYHVAGEFRSNTWTRVSLTTVDKTV